jgi:hypothetical protein
MPMAIDRGRHRSRIARVQRMIAFFPEPIPRLPIPDPPVLGKRTFCSYRTHSDAGLVFFKQQHVARAYPERPADATGTVIRPFDVIFACFSNAIPPRK